MDDNNFAESIGKIESLASSIYKNISNSQGKSSLKEMLGKQLKELNELKKGIDGKKYSGKDIKEKLSGMKKLTDLLSKSDIVKKSAANIRHKVSVVPNKALDVFSTFENNSIDDQANLRDVKNMMQKTAGKLLEYVGKTLKYAGKALETAAKAMKFVGKALEMAGKAASSIPYIGKVIGPVLAKAGKAISIAAKGVKFAGKGIGYAGKGIEYAGKKIAKQPVNTLKPSPVKGKVNKQNKPKLDGVIKQAREKQKSQIKTVERAVRRPKVQSKSR